MEDIIVKSKLGKKILLFIVSLFFVFMGYYYTFSAYETFIKTSEMRIETLFLFLLGTITFLFFGYCAFSYFKSIFNNVAISATKEGIYEDTSSIKWGLIEWKDIESIELIKFLNQEFIEIKVKDIEKYMDRLSKISMFFQRMNIKMGFEICIVTNTLKTNPEVVCTLLQEYHRYILEKRG